MDYQIKAIMAKHSIYTSSNTVSAELIIQLLDTLTDQDERLMVLKCSLDGAEETGRAGRYSADIEHRAFVAEQILNNEAR